MGFVNYLNNVSITTKYAYLNDIINFINAVSKPIEAISLDDFTWYISKIEYKKNGEMTTSSYRIAVYSALKRFSKYLYVTKRISEDYMLSIERPKAFENQKTIEKREDGFLTTKEISIYINNIEENFINRFRQVGDDWNKRDMLIIKIFLSTGIRCSALNKLDVSSINFENKTLLVTDKGDKVKSYDLTEELLLDIKEWMDIRNSMVKNHEQALFISNQRTRMDQSSIYRVVNKYSKGIKDKKITPHKLRATYGTQLYNETKDIYFVQECMGHNNPKTTERYVRGKKDNMKKASVIMSRLTN